VRWLGLACVAAYGALIVWIYASQPATLAEVAGGVTSTFGAYTVDRVNFDEGLDYFHRDRFVEARAAFARADPAGRDATTQFYIAYSYYRQGWGRVYHDDAMMNEALAAVDRAIRVAPGGRIVVDDDRLGLKTADELRAEIVQGLSREWSDLNPLRVFRERR
jgi:hypothetical protein